MPSADPQSPIESPVVESVDSLAPLEQADLFRAVDDASNSAGIVVTADCDLARSKHWGCLNWVPVVSAESYIASSFLFDEVEREAERLTLESFRQLAKTRVDRGLPSVSEEAYRDAVGADDTEGIAAVAVSCGLPELPSTVSAIAMARSAVRVAPPRHSEWPAEAIDRMFDAFGALTYAKGGNKAKLAERCTARLKSLPGDAFLIPDHRRSTLSVALLRFVCVEPITSFRARIGEAREAGARYYRYARLLAPFRYDLTRRLGAVFSDIGLPDHYEASRDLRVAELAHSWKGRFA